MNAADPASHIARNILLCTDMSARCDRALDRAAQLAKQWQARLTVVHALESGRDFFETHPLRDLPSWRRPEDHATSVRQRLGLDLREAGVTAQVIVAQGDPGEIALRAAQQLDIDLIVTGLARDDSWGRVLLGTTVDHLVRRASCPILVVKNKVRNPYREIVIATDFSAASQQALHTAVRFFPGGKLSLFNAYHSPQASLTETDAMQKGWETLTRQDCARFLGEAALPEEVARRLDTLIEHGHPAILLRDLVQQRHIDLVLLGTHGRNLVQQLFLGSTATTLLHAVPCDIMVVRPAQRTT